jgi:type I restriction enzyme M protein
MLTNNIKAHIDRLWSKFWGGGIVNPLTAIEQITYLLFMKRIDELDSTMLINSKKRKKSYVSIFEGSYQPHGSRSKSKSRPKSDLRWRNFKLLKSEEMLTHIEFNVFPFIKNLNGENSPFVKSMQNAVFIMPKASLLKDAVDIIEELYKEIETGLKGKQGFQDTQGDVYEYLLSEIATAGKMGQFRTPRHIIKLICDMIEPKLGDKIADPACGTGGFLLGAYQYILTKFSSKAQLDEDGFFRGTGGDQLTEEDDIVTLEKETFYGYDIDPSMVRIGLMNLMMHGITVPHLENKDTLSKSFNEDNIYDVILANPPFTGSIDKGDLNPNLSLGTTKTELLFIERIFKMLKDGGTAGIIIPQGVLFGAGIAFKKTRRLIIEKCQLKAVVTMPSGVFKPYAGVATAILIFTKAAITDNVWFYEMQSDGYTLDDKRSKTNNSDLLEIVNKYKTKDKSKKNDRSSKSFHVTVNEIIEKDFDLSINRYKIEIYTPLSFEDPIKILKNLSALEKQIKTGVKQLENLLK